MFDKTEVMKIRKQIIQTIQNNDECVYYTIYKLYADRTLQKELKIFNRYDLAMLQEEIKRSILYFIAEGNINVNDGFFTINDNEKYKIEW